MTESKEFTPQPPDESFEKLLSFAEFFGLGVWKYDLTAQKLEWDTSVYSRYSVDRKAFPTPFDFWDRCLTEESKIQAEKEMQLAISRTKQYDATYELKLPTGETRYVWARARTVTDENDRPIYLQGINLDVTDQALVEQENRHLLAKLREAQAIAKIGSWTFDLTTQELTWSHELYKIYDIPEPQPKGTLYPLYRSRIHPEDRAELDRAIALACRTGEGYVLNYRLVLQNGNIRHVQGVGKVTLDINGNPAELSGTCRDRTLEIETQRTIENERSKATRNAHLAALGELSAGVAHEINNPLAIIECNLYLLAKSGDLPPSVASNIKLIDGAWRRISKIVNGLKKFARSDETAVFSKHLLREIVADALTLVEVQAKRHGVKLVTDLATEVEIHCDRLHIEQVLINLINNAVDAVKANADRWVKVSLSVEGSFAVLQVTDSGAGVSKQNRDKLFTPFYTTKAIGEGTGLGLSITKGIVDEHRGTITYLEDSPHTCFELRLKKAEVPLDA